LENKSFKLIHMKTRFTSPMRARLGFGLGLLLGLHLTPGYAQNSVVAGQTAGMRYVDLVPNTVLTYTPANCCAFLDVDGDGTDDLKIVTQFTGQGSTQSIAAYALSLNPNLAMARVLANTSMTAAMGPNVVITAPFTAPNNTIFDWDAPTLTNGYNLAVHSGVAPRDYIAGYWYGTTAALYMPFSLRSGSSVRFGWVLMQNDNNFHFTIDSYALQNAAPLATATGALASRLQVYPNPTTDLVQIDFHGGPLVVSVINSLGQMLATQALAAGQPLSLAKLPAGLYTLRIESSAGVATRRIQKQ
jgi:hypothetical protein